MKTWRQLQVEAVNTYYGEASGTEEPESPETWYFYTREDQPTDHWLGELKEGWLFLADFTSLETTSTFSDVFITDGERVLSAQAGETEPYEAQKERTNEASASRIATNTNRSRLKRRSIPLNGRSPGIGK